MDLEELKKMVLNAKTSTSVIASGKLFDCNNNSHTYEITHGWDPVSSKNCDEKWSAYYLELFELIRDQKYEEEKIVQLLSEIQLEDFHWNWFKKSMKFYKSEYEWFYIFTDDEPQGACLFYHPKESIIDARNIFYIEFIAVAPWNRDNPMGKRKFKGIGSTLLKCTLEYAVNTLGLEYGFSLHSLPQAQRYYEKIGMKYYPERDKDNLKYLEMPRAESSSMLEVT